MKKQEKGITLIALVITIIILLILATVSIATLTGENGIVSKTHTAQEKTKREEIIESARVDILAQQAENLEGSITENELITILNQYGKLSDEDETSILEKTLTTAEGNQKIKVSEIWNGTLKVPINFTVFNKTFSAMSGDTWDDFLRLDIKESGRENGEWGIGGTDTEDLVCIWRLGADKYSASFCSYS